MEHVFKNSRQEFKCDKHGGQKNHWYVHFRADSAEPVRRHFRQI